MFALIIILYCVSVIKPYPFDDNPSTSKLTIFRLHRSSIHTEHKLFSISKRAIIQNGSIYIDTDNTAGLSNLDLILGLGLGIPLLLISATLVICGCCCHRLKCFKSCLSKMCNYSDDYIQSNRNLVENSQTPSELSSGKNAQTNKNVKTSNQRTIINKEYVSNNNSSDGKSITSAKNTTQREGSKGLNNSNSSNNVRSLHDTDHSSINESKPEKKANDIKEVESANNEFNEDSDHSLTNESNKNNTTKSYDLRELPLAYDFDHNRNLTTTNVKHLRFLNTPDYSEQQIPIDEKSSMVMNMTRTSLFSPPIEGLPTADVQYTHTSNPGSVLVHAYSVQENKRSDSTPLC
ncbi:unnamed protein product [Adineta ricciae]|uniref:Uncharacterized protein n=1 Tax=Adineta ricciae TaxID=249248 RepID=A0A815LU40_ADIRI|nr:unnamed protein product [Adineta ricciae]CAF1413974.1 unnamed protein product [Adineta ricciae]